MKMQEFNEGRAARLILSGEWLYDGIASRAVRVFALNYDFYFDLDEGYLDDGEKPELNDHGEQYVVVWHNEPFFSASSYPSEGFMTLAEAKDYAISVVQGITWHQPGTKTYV